MLGFPEEVARRLTMVEMGLYRKVPAAFYLRHATSTGGRKVVSWKHPTVQDLIERFGDVRNNMCYGGQCEPSSACSYA